MQCKTSERREEERRVVEGLGSAGKKYGLATHMYAYRYMHGE